MQETLPNNSNRKEFAVGDTVYCAVLGKGTVYQISSGCKFPVAVKFDCLREEYYTKDGKIYVGANRTLFFSPASIVAGETEKPFNSELVGKEVLIEFHTAIGGVSKHITMRVQAEDEKQLNGVSYTSLCGITFNKSSIKSIQILGKKITL